MTRKLKKKAILITEKNESKMNVQRIDSESVWRWLNSVELKIVVLKKESNQKCATEVMNQRHMAHSGIKSL